MSENASGAISLAIPDTLRARVRMLMQVPGCTDLVLYVRQGKAIFAVIREEMLKMFYVTLDDDTLEANYCIPKETVNFLFQSGNLLVLEANEMKLQIRSEASDPLNTKRVTIPLRRDYSFQVLDDITEFIQGTQQEILKDFTFLRQLAQLCKFQKSGVIVRGGWGMIDTPMFKICRETSYGGDLVLSEKTLTQFISYIQDTSELRIGRVGRYTVCVNPFGLVFAFVRIKNRTEPFIHELRAQKPIASFSADMGRVSELLASVIQQKTQDVKFSLDFRNGIARTFERTKGEYSLQFYAAQTAGTQEIGTLEFNFKVMKSLLTTNLAFGICKVDLYKSILSITHVNGLIILVKRGN